VMKASEASAPPRRGLCSSGRSMNWLIDGLAVWRISSLLVNEIGPWYVFRRLRELLGFVYYDDGDVLRRPDNHVLSCVWCTSLWVAMLVFLLPKWLRRALSLSALAIIVEEHAGYGNR
jgi:hypothetical protein